LNKKLGLKAYTSSVKSKKMSTVSCCEGQVVVPVTYSLTYCKSDRDQRSGK